jgi:anti-sigma-K factor RskA
VDIQEYISGGAIESYVLGVASADDVREVETLAAQHPEVKAAITAFGQALEIQAIANGVPPPHTLKQRVMDALAKEGMITSVIESNTAAKEPAKVISLTAAPKGVKWLRGAIAASIILLLGSAILNFYFYSQYKKYSKDYADLLVANNAVTAKNEVLQASYNMLKDTSMMQVKMQASSPERGGAYATVLWDRKGSDVYLMVNSLPQHPSDKQYQLWAIVDGKPVDAGMLEMNDTEGLLKMKNIKGNVQAFAITLEKKGGSPSPDMTQMYVVGNI